MANHIPRYQEEEKQSQNNKLSIEKKTTNKIFQCGYQYTLIALGPKNQNAIASCKGVLG